MDGDCDLSYNSVQELGARNQYYLFSREQCLVSDGGCCLDEGIVNLFLLRFVFRCGRAPNLQTSQQFNADVLSFTNRLKHCATIQVLCVTSASIDFNLDTQSCLN